MWPTAVTKRPGKRGWLPTSASLSTEAERLGAALEVMLAHPFSQTLEHYDDYSRFAALYGVDAEPNKIVHADNLDGLDFFIGWVVSNMEYLSR